MRREIGGVLNVTPARRVCGWCGLILAPGGEPVTTGICPECVEIHFPTVAGDFREAVQAEGRARSQQS